MYTYTCMHTHIYTHAWFYKVKIKVLVELYSFCRIKGWIWFLASSAFRGCIPWPVICSSNGIILALTTCFPHYISFSNNDFMPHSSVFSESSWIYMLIRIIQDNLLNSWSLILSHLKTVTGIGVRNLGIFGGEEGNYSNYHRFLIGSWWKHQDFS